MEKKTLKKLRRTELLELMLEQSRRIDELEAELAEAEAKLEARKLMCRESGSLAEAALKLNGVFEAAQKAADDYLANLKMGSQEEA